LKVSVGICSSAFSTPFALCNNSFLARILESDKAENLGPSEKFVVCVPITIGMGFLGIVEIITSELLISVFGSAIALSIRFFSLLMIMSFSLTLVLPLPFSIKLPLIFSTIE
jgi:hypothetical protein